MGGRYTSTTPFWLESRSDMTGFPQVVTGSDWSDDLVRFKLIILISRRWSKEKEERTNKNGRVRRGASFLQEPTTLAEGRMLENKRERLKTFLRKIDEKAIVRIKYFMKERWGMNVWAEPLSAGWASSTGWMLTVSFLLNDSQPERIVWFLLFNTYLYFLSNTEPWYVLHLWF